jgi:hypothetical protein
MNVSVYICILDVNFPEFFSFVLIISTLFFMFIKNAFLFLLNFIMLYVVTDL